jgi:hypothetical protein
LESNNSIVDAGLIGYLKVFVCSSLIMILGITLTTLYYNHKYSDIELLQFINSDKREFIDFGSSNVGIWLNNMIFMSFYFITIVFGLLFTLFFIQISKAEYFSSRLKTKFIVTNIVPTVFILIQCIKHSVLFIEICANVFACKLPGTTLLDSVLHVSQYGIFEFLANQFMLSLSIVVCLRVYRSNYKRLKRDISLLLIVVALTGISLLFGAIIEANLISNLTLGET